MYFTKNKKKVGTVGETESAWDHHKHKEYSLKKMRTVSVLPTLLVVTPQIHLQTSETEGAGPTKMSHCYMKYVT